jgi:hypothetical protein
VSVTTLGRHHNALLRQSVTTRSGRAALIVPGLIGLAFGIASSAPADEVVLLTLGGGLIGLAFVWARVRRRAIELALREWGEPRGFAYEAKPELAARTRWLRQTDGKVGAGLTGPVAGGSGGICHYTYTTGSGKDRDEHPYTLAFAGFAPIPGLPSLSFGARGGGSMFDGIVGFVSSDREVELESVEFEERFSIWVADETDDLAVRRLFTPAVMTRFLDAPPTSRLELAGPMLLIARDRHLVEPADLDEILAGLEQWAATVSPLRSA